MTLPRPCVGALSHAAWDAMAHRQSSLTFESEYFVYRARFAGGKTPAPNPSSALQSWSLI